MKHRVLLCSDAHSGGELQVCAARARFPARVSACSSSREQAPPFLYARKSSYFLFGPFFPPFDTLCTSHVTHSVWFPALGDIAEGHGVPEATDVAGGDGWRRPSLPLQRAGYLPSTVVFC